MATEMLATWLGYSGLPKVPRTQALGSGLHTDPEAAHRAEWGGWGKQYLVWAQAGLGWLQEWLQCTEGRALGPDMLSPFLLELLASVGQKQRTEYTRLSLLACPFGSRAP